MGQGQFRSMTVANLALVGVQRDASSRVRASGVKASDAATAAADGSACTIAGGAPGGNAGTLTGPTIIDGGVPAANQSAKLQFFANGASICDMSLPGLSNRFGITAVGVATILRLNGATGFELQAAAATILDVGVSQTGFVTYSANQWNWSLSLLGPLLVTQPTKSSDAACAMMMHAPQPAFATATGANRTPGGFTVRLAVQSNGGGSGVQDAATDSVRWENSGSAVLRRLEQSADRVQTTDATGLVRVLQRTVADNTIERWRVRFVCRKPSTGDCASLERTFSVKRHAAGVASIVGAVRTPVADDTDAALVGIAVGLLTPGGAFATANVTGLAATTLEWAAFVDVVTMTP